MKKYKDFDKELKFEENYTPLITIDVKLSDDVKIASILSFIKEDFWGCVELIENLFDFQICSYEAENVLNDIHFNSYAEQGAFLSKNSEILEKVNEGHFKYVYYEDKQELKSCTKQEVYDMIIPIIYDNLEECFETIVGEDIWECLDINFK